MDAKIFFVHNAANREYFKEEGDEFINFYIVFSFAFIKGYVHSERKLCFEVNIFD